jgi:PAS domain S-box-containing protein
MDYVKEKKSDMHNVVTKADQATESCPGCQVCSDKGGAAPRKLRVELAFLLIFALLAVGIVAAGYSYYCHHQKVFLAEVDRQLTSIAELKVGELEQWREDRQTDASLFFKNPTFSALVSRFFKNPGDSDAQRQLHDWLAKYATMEDYNLVRLLDVQGNARLSMPAGVQSVSAAVLKAALEALQSGQITLQDFYQSERDQGVYLAVIVPLFDEMDAHRPLGVLVLRIDPKKYLFPFIQRWPTPSATAETQLVRRDGDEVVFLSDLRSQTNVFHALRISVKKTAVLAVRAVLGQTGIVSDSLDYRGVPVTAYVHPVPESPWFLVAKIDRDEIRAPLSAQLWQLVLLVGSLILGAGAGVALILRHQHIRFYQGEIRAAQKLLMSENQYRELFESSADALFLVAEDTGQFIEANNMASVLYGYERNELLAKKNSDLSAEPEESKRFLQETQFKPGQVFHVPVRLHRKKEGTVFPVEITARSLIRDDKGVLLVACRDITVRQQAEEELSASEKRFRTLVEIAPDAIFIQTNGCFAYVNAAALQLFGAACPDDLLGQPVLNRFHPDFRDIVRERIRVLNEERQSVASKDEVGLTLAGTPIDMNVSAVPFTYQHQNGALVIAHDISERKKAEAALNQQAEDLRVRNDALARFNAITVGRELRMIELKREVNELSQKLGEPPRHKIVDTPEQTRDEVQALNRESPNLTRTLLQTNAELRALDQRKNQFLAMAAHDLRNPLSVIMAYSEFLLDEAGSQLSEEQQQYLHTCVEAVMDMKQLIDGFLDLSVIESGELQLDLTLASAQEVIDNAAPIAQLMAGKKNITLIMESADDVRRLRVDKTKFQQVILNLVGNAVEHSASDKRVWISSQGVGTDVVFAVRDEASDISPEYTARLFTSAWWVGPRRPPVERSIELSIASARLIVKAHGGRIWGESHLGQGTTFFVSLPTGQAEQP